jgi:hypothetical protein
VSGWPDAYTIGDDGRLDLVEATRDERNWRQHLASDISRIERLGANRIRGFVFVAWALDPGPVALDEERSRIRSLRVPDKNITFVFRQQLVAEMQGGRHALTWMDLLGLAPA